MGDFYIDTVVLPIELRRMDSSDQAAPDLHLQNIPQRDTEQKGRWSTNYLDYTAMLFHGYTVLAQQRSNCKDLFPPLNHLHPESMRRYSPGMKTKTMPELSFKLPDWKADQWGRCLPVMKLPERRCVYDLQPLQWYTINCDELTTDMKCSFNKNHFFF